jgi:hypothetical protein
MRREEVLSWLRPYWSAMASPTSSLLKSLETYVYVVSRSKENWSFIIRNGHSLLRDEVADELARVYLACREALGPKHVIAALLFDSLNTLCAAMQVGPENMRDLISLTTKASFAVRR